MSFLQEVAIQDYFKPIDKQAEVIMKMQLEGEEKTMKEMMKTMQQQAFVQKDELEKLVEAQYADLKQHKQTTDKVEEMKTS